MSTPFLLLAAALFGWAPAAHALGHFTLKSLEISRHKYVPPIHRSGQLPLVVALHGCQQTAREFEEGAGLNHLADEKGFIVLYPEQHRLRNLSGCWNWHDPVNQTRSDGGEAAALVRQIENTLEATPQADPHQVYVLGFSAGAAMANILVSCYPDLFQGAALVAGTPYGVADTFIRALEAQGGKTSVQPEMAANMAHGCSGFKSTAVPVIILQGRTDRIVDPVNADWVERQFQVMADLKDDGLQNRSVILEVANDCMDASDNRVCRRETRVGGRVLVETVLIPDLGHAWLGPVGERPFFENREPHYARLIWSFFENGRRSRSDHARTASP